MSDDKNLRDDLNDMLDDAKESSKEFAQDAKTAAKEFANDAKETYHEASSDGKTVAIIAHITLIGWIIALIMNSNNKSEFGSFYIRQMLGLGLIGIALGWIPLLGFLVGLVLLAAWIMSLVSAAGGTMKPTFLLGDQFQEWFKSL
jgi:hypothetical protein